MMSIIGACESSAATRHFRRALQLGQVYYLLKREGTHRFSDQSVQPGIEKGGRIDASSQSPCYANCSRSGVLRGFVRQIWEITSDREATTSGTARMRRELQYP